MPKQTSFIPPHVTPPDPLVVRILALSLSLFLSFVLALFIGFMCIEFLLDMLGKPLNWGAQVPPYNVELSTEPDTHNLLESPIELITPKHHTKMLGPEVAVIYTQRLPENSHEMPPVLLIDDNPHPWEIQFGNNTWFARLQLQPGLHYVQVEGTEAEFTVATADSLSQLSGEWTWNRPHPDTDKADRCYDCHEINVQQTDRLTMNRTFALGAWKGAKSCFACHEREEHTVRHATLISTSNQCFRCHSIH